MPTASHFITKVAVTSLSVAALALSAVWITTHAAEPHPAHDPNEPLPFF